MFASAFSALALLTLNIYAGAHVLSIKKKMQRFTRKMLQLALISLIQVSFTINLMKSSAIIDL